MALHSLATSEGACSEAELLAGIGLYDANGNYKRHLLPLIEGGYWERTIPKKRNSQNQYHRITDAGLEIVAGRENTR